VAQKLRCTDLRPSRRALRLHADAPPQVIQEGEMIEFLAQMPSDTMIIYHNGSSGFGCNADRAEMADLRPCTSPTRRSQRHFYGPFTSVVQKIALTARWLWPRNCVRGPTAKPLCIAFTRRCSAPSHPRRGDDRVSGTDADRHDDIYHNGISGFGGNADRAEMADLRPCTH
jgi:hypothetical protein